MSTRLRVYGWTAYHIRGVEKAQHNYSFRCFVAAPTKADVLRITGKDSPSRLFNLHQVKGGPEFTLATSKPSVVFYRLDHVYGDAVPYGELADPAAVL